MDGSITQKADVKVSRWNLFPLPQFTSRLFGVLVVSHCSSNPCVAELGGLPTLTMVPPPVIIPVVVEDKTLKHSLVVVVLLEPVYGAPEAGVYVAVKQYEPPWVGDWEGEVAVKVPPFGVVMATVPAGEQFAEVDGLGLGPQIWKLTEPVRSGGDVPEPVTVAESVTGVVGTILPV